MICIIKFVLFSVRVAFTRLSFTSIVCILRVRMDNPAKERMNREKTKQNRHLLSDKKKKEKFMMKKEKRKKKHNGNLNNKWTSLSFFLFCSNRIALF